jgi:hypothetical protein
MAGATFDCMIPSFFNELGSIISNAGGRTQPSLALRPARTLYPRVAICPRPVSRSATFVLALSPLSAVAVGPAPAEVALRLQQI